MYISNNYIYRPGPIKKYPPGIFHKRREKKREIESTSIKLCGFDKILTPGLSKIRRIMWFLLITAISIFSIVQIYNRLDNFIHQHTAVTIDYEKNATLKTPCIIICPLILTRNLRLIEELFGRNDTKISPDELYNLVGESISVEKIWEVSDMITEELKLEFIEGLSLVDNWIIDNAALRAEKVNGMSGKCVRIHSIRDIVYNGLYTLIRIRTVNELPFKDGSFLQVSIQTETADHTERLFVAKQGVMFPLHAQVNLYYTLQEMKHISTSEYPCSTAEENSKCAVDCIDRTLYEEHKVVCRLPFMNPPDDTLKPCLTPDEFRLTYEIADKLMKNFSLEACKCPRICHSTLYNLKSASELHVDEEIALNLNIFFSDNSIQRITDYVSYDVTALLSDIGGTLGLYLGICLISVIEILEEIGLKIIAAINYKHAQIYK